MYRTFYLLPDRILFLKAMNVLFNRKVDDLLEIVFSKIFYDCYFQEDNIHNTKLLIAGVEDVMCYQLKYSSKEIATLTIS